MRTLDEITKIVELYPPEHRRWCEGPCACMGCVRVPAPLINNGRPMSDGLTKEEFELWECGKQK